MRTAEEILKEVTDAHTLRSVYVNGLAYMMIRAINEARIEAINRCAEEAKSEWLRYGANMGHAVDKESILKLIDKVK